MTDDPISSTGSEEDKQIPRLSKQEKRLARSDGDDDAALAEAKLFGAGASRNDWEQDAKSNEAKRAEAFRDQFEIVSIIAMWFGAAIFAIFTVAWAANLVLPKKKQFLDENQEDKLQLIITGGFVAGIASSHFKKRLGG